MKTIDEAMASVVYQCSDRSEMDAKAAEMSEHMEKRRSIADEIARNPIVLDYIEKYLDAVGPKLDYDVNSLALSVFVNGVLIGMEMERQELNNLDQHGSGQG